MEGVKLDKWGYEVKTSSDSCISAINAFYDQELSYGRERSVILQAPVHDEHCVLGNILAAHFLYFSDPSRASSHLHAAKARLEQATSYEKAVFEAINYLVYENRDDDVAFELHSKLCHVLQYEYRIKEAIEFMEECSSSWSSLSSFMYTHNWWHVALCYLEGHSSMRKVLEIYDGRIWKELERPDAACAEVYLNALGLLLRVYVRGEHAIFENRLKIIADCLTNQATWYLEWHLDVLTLWALASTGEFVKAEDLLGGLKSRISMMNKKQQKLMQRGLMLAEALYEYGRGNYKQALELLGPDFDANDFKMIGASDEQLDVFNEVWLSMLLSTGQATKAIEVLEKRIKKREGIPFLWRLLEKGYSMAGREETTIASEKASALETAYFK